MNDYADETHFIPFTLSLCLTPPTDCARSPHPGIQRRAYAYIASPAANLQSAPRDTARALYITHPHISI